MPDPIKIQSRSKIFVALLLAILFLGGLGGGIYKYLEIIKHQKPAAAENPLEQPAVNPAQLAEIYNQKAAKIFSDYFAAANVSGADLAQLSRQAQNQLLDLVLPTKNERHLQEVALLGEIAELTDAGQAAAALAKLNQLKELVNQK